MSTRDQKTAAEVTLLRESLRDFMTASGSIQRYFDEIQLEHVQPNNLRLTELIYGAQMAATLAGDKVLLIVSNHLASISKRIIQKRIQGQSEDALDEDVTEIFLVLNAASVRIQTLRSDSTTRIYRRNDGALDEYQRILKAMQKSQIFTDEVLGTLGPDGRTLTARP